MRILIVSSLRRGLGPDITASRSHMIYNLAEGLIRRGHSVSILAPGNSVVKGAIIIPVIDRALAELPPFENQFYAETAYLALLAKKIQDLAPNFDVIHNHTYPEYINLLVEETLPVPMVTTLHGPVTEELTEVVKKFPKANIVAQSESYQKLIQTARIPWVVPSGINPDIFSYSEEIRDYLLWIGRLGKGRDSSGKFIDGKGVKDAIEVAIKTMRKLVLLGNIEDEEFYQAEVAPYLSEQIKWVSPLSSEQNISKGEISKLMQGAKALLFPTKFEESFGFVAIEAMACGTPVIGYARGSLPSIIEDNVTGFMINPSTKDRRGNYVISETGVTGLIKAVEKIYNLDDKSYKFMQKSSRKRVEKLFTIDKMISNYEALYRGLLKNSKLR